MYPSNKSWCEYKRDYKLNEWMREIMETGSEHAVGSIPFIKRIF